MGNRSAEKLLLRESRLVDRAIGFGIICSEQRVLDSMYEALAQARVIQINNVAQYYTERAKQRKEEWGFADFPNIAPPFETMFVEHDEATTCIKDANKEKPTALGVLFESVKMKPKDKVEELLYSQDEHGEKIERVFHVTAFEAKWYTRATLFVEFERGKPVQIVGEVRLYIDHAGGAYLFDGGWATSVYGYSNTDTRLKLITMKTHSKQSLFPALLAISLMHCKNVELVEREPDAKAARIYQQKTKRTLTRYETLVIEPMRKVLKSAGAESDSVGLKRALHTVRGHMKDYRQRGLFGRSSHRGMYFWHDNVRGELDSGVVVKDYRVDKPQQQKESTT
jgi:hypothetical protein